MRHEEIKIISITKTFKSAVFHLALLSAIYAILFITFMMFVEKQSLDLGTLISFHLNNPYIFLIEILPLLTALTIHKLIEDISEKTKDIEREIAWLNAKNRAIYSFVEQLRRGNTDVSFSNEFIRDRLIQSLIRLRDELKRSREEEEQRKKEERQRHWINEGLAKFADILRENLDDLQRLAESITSNLTRYLDAKQAAFFIIEEEEIPEEELSKYPPDLIEEKVDEEGRKKYVMKYFKMIAFFAYDRKKFPNKRLKWKEGLIGAAAIEKRVIVLNDTTEDFVEVTSGLGGANPRAIIIAPLVDNEGNVHGVIEMASFSPFEDYQVQFIEQVSRSIADTIANIKRNLRTQQLLKESQEQARLLKKQEEQMRKNMEELKMLQLEAAKQSEEFVSFTNSVNRALIRAEFTREGFLIYANENFLRVLEYDDYFEIINKHITQFLAESEREIFDTLWTGFIDEDKVYDADIKFVTKTGNEKWISSTLIGIKNKEGKTIKVLFLGLDRTEEKILQFEYISEIKFVNNIVIKIDFDAEGNVIDANNTFLNLIGAKREEILNKHYSEIFAIEEMEDFNIIWQTILNGRSYNTVHKVVTNYNTTIWFEAYYSAVIIGKTVKKVVLYGIDITRVKKLEQDVKALEEQIKLKDEVLNELEDKLNKTQQEFELKYQELETTSKLFIQTFDHLDRAVVAINETGHIVLFNPLAEELWQLKKDVVIGKRLSSILPDLPEKNDDDVDYLLDYFNLEKPLLQERRLSFIIDKTGRRVNIRVFITKVEIENRILLTAFIEKMEV